MNRRRYLQSIGVSSIAAAAGCLDSLPDSDGARAGTSENSDRKRPDGVVLGPPEQDLSEASHPSYGDDVPSVSVPDPLSDQTVSTDQFEGDRSILLTFFYTSCPDGVCPALLLRLRRAQEAAAERGYGDSIAFLAMTFDPERDTESVLETYADEQGIDDDAENWHFLRPERYDDGEEIVTEQFGLPLEKRDADEYENLDYMFPHFAYIFLVNERGLVERVYPDGATVPPSEVVDDLETVVNG
ncbi:electron transporter SenC [Halostagnicola sp. A56]|uniref:SCO family protein n=1 Tax=Halostagnicola sp. A56 TaxID=1495067 RepID=UPI0004A0E792|nr:SCO family protein [Halostagnicola sp. A56]KDE60402.1 electron transporter SenC [Halostagnicola sp. A56]